MPSRRILDGFRWIGIDWDEGPEVGGPHRSLFPVTASRELSRGGRRLLASGHVYRDYSTESERAAEKTAAERDKRAYRFRRKARSADQSGRRFEAEGRPFALRFRRSRRGARSSLHDLIKGDVEFATDEIGDFVIVRPDGTPLYNFASVVDDVAMQITHVVRADEHLSNTFPQLLLFEALGAPLPAFAHVPYVAEPGSKSKMSKRKHRRIRKARHPGLPSPVHRKGLPARRAAQLPVAAGLELRRLRRRSSPAPS